MIGPNAARLHLPDRWKIHNVFHVSLLRPCRGTPFPRPLPDLIEGEPYFKVDRILSHRQRKVGRRVVHEYLIKWLGYPDTDNSWEPESNLTPDLVQAYKA